MVIAGMQKLTLLDYPGHMACIIFTKGCNFNCSFCQNSGLICNTQDEEYIKETEVLEYLEKRKKVLDGLVISGGEPTLQKDLKEFIKKVKGIGLKVKLDTNGYNPKFLQELLDENLLDYVAMDVKADMKNNPQVIGKGIIIERIKESINILIDSSIDYEFRTTIIKGIHDVDKIKEILELIGPKSKYYIQNFKLSENVIDKTLQSFSNEELEEIETEIRKKYKLAKVRGLYKEVGGNSYV